MKKIAKALSLTLALVMLLALCACGGGSKESTAPESTAPESTAPEGGVSADWMGADLNGVAGAVGGGWYSTFAAFTELMMEKEPLLTFKVSPGSGIGNSATIGEGTFDIG